MKNQSSLPRWSSLCVLAFIAFLYCSYSATASDTSQSAPQGRADFITMQSATSGSNAELPPVIFPHDTHTKALEAMGKDCSTCHTSIDGSQEFRFRDGPAQSAEDIKDYYHDNCLSCHATVGEKYSAPLAADCRSCHLNTAPDTSGWNEIPFAKELHNLHITSKNIPNAPGFDANCGTCHVTYDENMVRIAYAPFTEASCRSCHNMDAEQAAILEKNPDAKVELPLRTISHMSCVGCHATTKMKNPEIATGPIDCAGCHSSAAVAPLIEANLDKERLKAVPRLQRNQPDTTLILPRSNSGEVFESTTGIVSFNHALHESITQDCRTCHHQQISSCGTCHTVEGNEKGDYNSLSSVMHKPDSLRSCIGCHEVAKAKPECASCHLVTPQQPTQTACITCHSTQAPVTGGYATSKNIDEMSQQDFAAISGLTVDIRQSKRTNIPFASIPEYVTIDILSNEYGKATFPHRAIVTSLARMAKDNSLASAFHTTDLTLCVGCHHNAPESLEPPKCVSCHSTQNAPGKNDLPPTLKEAYHQQCMGCHIQIQQTPVATDCTGCHEQRKN